ncbi:CinA family protein [Actinotalea sp.]|uniref:CinA family protein n=1 Tax=Actinotalea sp. TaxID=1872145 RepID=UPI0035669700
MTAAGPSGAGSGEALAGELVATLTRQGRTLAVAESLTGGALCAALVSVPGASACVRGGVVAYATDLKESLLGVPAALLGSVGAVHPDTARAMASGARSRLGADLGVATTGVAGPDPQDGRPVGEVHIALCDERGCEVVTLHESPSSARAAVREAAVLAALALLVRRSAAAAAPGE